MVAVGILVCIVTRPAQTPPAIIDADAGDAGVSAVAVLDPLSDLDLESAARRLEASLTLFAQEQP